MRDAAREHVSQRVAGEANRLGYAKAVIYGVGASQGKQVTLQAESDTSEYSIWNDPRFLASGR